MWKNSYKIGDKLIDSQHQELFKRTEKLLRIIEGENPALKKQECINAILFLKGYAVDHFAAEEAYMKSINYKDIEAHAKLHKSFVGQVLEAEAKMIEADFSLQSVRQFTGFLMTWLIYHVAGADQKIARDEALAHDVTEAQSYVDGFVKSIAPVLETMVALTERAVVFGDGAGEDDVISIFAGMSGDKMGEVVFIFPKETALNLVNALTPIKLPELNDTALSALTEIVNTISCNAASLIVASGTQCVTQRPVIQTQSADAFATSDFRINTDYGPIAVSVNVV